MHEGRLRGATTIAVAFLFALPSAALMGYGVFFADGDMTTRLGTFGLFLPLAVATSVLVGMLYKALFAQRIERRRWNRIGVQLDEMGFRDAASEEAQETLGIPVVVLAPPILGTQQGGGIDHVKIGEVAGRELRCFNVRIRGAGWLDVPAVALRVNASFPTTSIRPFRSPLRPMLDMKRVRFEHEAFNRSVAVFSIDPYFASALVDARMIEWLTSRLDGAVIELGDRWVLVWGFRRRFRGRRPLELLALLVQFAQQMPRVVPALFPEDDLVTSGSMVDVGRA